VPEKPAESADATATTADGTQSAQANPTAEEQAQVTDSTPAEKGAVKQSAAKVKSAQPDVVTPQDDVPKPVKQEVTAENEQKNLPTPAEQSAVVANAALVSTNDQSASSDDSPRKPSIDASKALATTITDALPPNQPAPANHAPVAQPAAPAPTPQAQFIEANHPKIISDIRGQLMPHGGSIQLRLDPPEMGALNVSINIKDGVVTASFETSNSDATRLLSHSLGDLKNGLEAAGVTVDKIHVQQGPRDQQTSAGDDDRRGQQQNQDASSQQRDQQRREMLRRMWRKVSGGDPVDLVA
jgi:flagellar hook-length control protein FliK